MNAPVGMDSDSADEDFLMDQNLSKRKLEEEEYYVDLAMQETQRWIEGVSKKPFSNSEDPKQSLASGVHLCQLLNSIKPGSVKRINKLPTLMAMMDNLNVFIEVCKNEFGLNSAQLFSVKDILPASERDTESCSSIQLRLLELHSLRSVAVTVFWLARQVQAPFQLTTKLDYSAFSAIVSAKESQTPASSPFSPPSRGFTGNTSHSAHDSVDSGAFIDGAGDNSMPMSKEESRRPAPYQSGSSTAGHVRRFSSCDSLEGSQSHSRQLSTDSWDSQQSGGGGGGLRRQSSSTAKAAPLQFIALKPADTLAKTAEETIQIMQEGKTSRKSFEFEDDWQSDTWKQDLSQWKSRRKSSSTKILAISAFRDALVEEDSHQQKPAEPKRTAQNRFRAAIVSQYPTADSADEDEAFVSPSSTDVNFQDPIPLSRGDKSCPPVPAPRQIKSKSYDSGIGTSSPKEPEDEDISNGAEPESERRVYPKIDSPVSTEFKPPPKMTSDQIVPSVPLKMVDGNYKTRLVAEPDTEGGFGFTIKGKLGNSAPFFFDSITPNLAADKMEVLEGDELLEINNNVLSGRNRGYCMLLVNESLREKGQVDMLIKRECSKVSPAAWQRKKSAEPTPKGLLAQYEAMGNPETMGEPVQSEPQVLTQLLPPKQKSTLPVEEADYEPLVVTAVHADYMVAKASDGEVETESEDDGDRRQWDRPTGNDAEESSPQIIDDDAFDDADGAAMSSFFMEDPSGESSGMATETMDALAVEQQYEAILNSPNSEDSETVRLRSTLQEQRNQFLGLGGSEEPSLTSPGIAQEDEKRTGVSREGAASKQSEDLSKEHSDNMIVQPRGPLRGAQVDSRLQSRRSLAAEEDGKRRMEEWSREQERLQRLPSDAGIGLEDQFEREQREIKSQYELSQRRAEEVEDAKRGETLDRRVSTGDAAARSPNTAASRSESTSASTARSLQNLASNLHEKDARQRAALRLMDIKRRLSSSEDQQRFGSVSDAGDTAAPSDEKEEADPAELELQRREEELRRMEERLRAEQQQILRQKEELRASKGRSSSARPELERQSAQYSDVMKYFNEVETPTIFDREPTPPPMSRRDVISLNRKSGTWESAPQPASTTPVRSNPSGPKPLTWSQRQAEAAKREPVKAAPPPSNGSVARPRESTGSSYGSMGSRSSRAAERPLSTSKSMGPGGAPWERRQSEQPQTRKISSIFDKEDETVMVRPAPKEKKEPAATSGPSSVMSREDVMKMNREKPRYSMTSESAVRYNPPRSSSIAGDNRETILKHQPEDERKKDPSPSSSSDSAPGFKGNLAKFEQKAKEADELWRQRRAENEERAEMRKSKSFQSAWKSFDHSASPDRSGPAQTARQERQKELAMIRGVREREDPVESGVDSGGERMRGERRKELEAIRRMNRELNTEGERHKSEEEERLRQERMREIESVRASREEIARREEDERDRREQELERLRHREEAQQNRQRTPSETDRKRQREAQLEAQAAERDRAERERIRQLEREEKEKEETLERDRSRAQREKEERERKSQEEQERRAREDMMQRRHAPIEEPIRMDEQPRHHSIPPMEDTEVFSIPRRAASNYQSEPPQSYGNAPYSPPNAYNGQPNGSAHTNGIQSPAHSDYAPPRPAYPSMDSGIKYGYVPPQQQMAAAVVRNMDPPPMHQYGAPPQMQEPPRPAARAPFEGDQPAMNMSPPVPQERNGTAPYGGDLSQGRYQGNESGYALSSNQSAPSPQRRLNSPSKPQQSEEDIVSVSARQVCIYCAKELGKGAAMVIESLGLYYHVQCFRCCVCHTLLSHGALGADVRVRGNKLHCRNCYSNDEAGIKYSAV